MISRGGGGGGGGHLKADVLIGISGLVLYTNKHASDERLFIVYTNAHTRTRDLSPSMFTSPSVQVEDVICLKRIKRSCR